MNKIYVYGTLMKNDGREQVRIPGVMYSLGWFPGVIAIELLCGSEVDLPHCTVLAEVIEVDDVELKRLDSYEGYCPDDPDGSLYIRIKYKDGYVYQYNQDTSKNVWIKDGDWTKYNAINRSIKKVTENV